MLAMSMFFLLGFAALLHAAFRLYKHEIGRAIGSFGMLLVVLGLYFYAQDWRQIAYQAIGEVQPVGLMATAEVYNLLMVLGALLLVIGVIITSVRRKKLLKTAKLAKTAKPVPQEPSRADLSPVG